LDSGFGALRRPRNDDVVVLAAKVLLDDLGE